MNSIGSGRAVIRRDAKTDGGCEAAPGHTNHCMQSFKIARTVCFWQFAPVLLLDDVIPARTRTPVLEEVPIRWPKAPGASSLTFSGGSALQAREGIGSARRDGRMGDIGCAWGWRLETYGARDADVPQRDEEPS